MKYYHQVNPPGFRGLRPTTLKTRWTTYEEVVYWDNIKFNIMLNTKLKKLMRRERVFLPPMERAVFIDRSKKYEKRSFSNSKR